MTCRRGPSTATAAYYDVRLELNSRSLKAGMISYYTEEVARLRLRVWCSAFRAGTPPKLGSEVPCWMAGHWARWGALELRLWIQVSAIERRCKPAVQANIYAFMFSAGSAMVWLWGRVGFTPKNPSAKPMVCKGIHNMLPQAVSIVCLGRTQPWTQPPVL